MSDDTYQTKVYETQGGDELVIASGGRLTIEAGATVTGLAAVTIQAAVADITENSGAIGGTQNGGFSALATAWDGTKYPTAAESALLIDAIRENSAKINDLLAKLRLAGVIAS